jgi:AAA domain
MYDATESSPSDDFYDSAQTRRARKKLGEKEAYKIVQSVYLEVWPQIEAAMANLTPKVGALVMDSMLHDAFTFACDDIADVNIHELSPEDIVNQARRALQVGLARAAPGTVVQFPGVRGDSLPIITAKDLMAREDLPDLGFLVENMIPFGKITGLGGEDGTGKSRLLLQLAVGVCSTAVWAGLRIPVATGPVIFYTVEETPRDMRSRLMKLARALKIDVCLDNLHIIAMGAEETAVLVAERARQGRSVSPNKKAGNYAPKELVSEHGGRDRRSRVAAIERTMESLFKQGRLKSESDGPPSKGKLKLVVASENRNTEAMSN